MKTVVVVNTTLMKQSDTLTLYKQNF